MYFNFFDAACEQDLIEDLIIESIQIYGHDVAYLPKTIVKEDHLFGEDILQKYESETGPLEVYIKDVDGFQGDGDVFGRLGAEIKDQITFTVAQKRWREIRTEKVLNQIGFTIQLETANTVSPGNTHALVMETGTTGNTYNITSSRPLEGDLIYFPMVHKLFEVKFVEHEAMFYQTGKLQTYDMVCELYAYSSEQLNTGNTVIDAIETAQSADILFHQITLETATGSGSLLEEDQGDFVIQEYRLEATDPLANNEYFQAEGYDIIDFSESNPFSELDRW
jgi:hypothetical protein